MSLKQKTNTLKGVFNLDFLAKQVVEGFMSGLHKSPFHGFSSEFAEHKIYNKGESTKHIDWKLFAKTEKLYTKKYDEETNLRCHFILDNSSSMHYPVKSSFKIDDLNKSQFSILAIASIIQLLKKQRDAFGLSVFSDKYDFFTPDKGSERHYHKILNKLEETVNNPNIKVNTNTAELLNLIAEKVKRRSLVIIFSDMFQTSTSNDKLFDALKHLKHNKHEVLLFHTYHKDSEFNLNFENKPLRFTDIETEETLDVFSDNIKENYTEKVSNYFQNIKNECIKYKIKYFPVNCSENFNKTLLTYLIERQKFS